MSNPVGERNSTSLVQVVAILKKGQFLDKMALSRVTVGKADYVVASIVKSHSRKPVGSSENI